MKTKSPSFDTARGRLSLVLLQALAATAILTAVHKGEAANGTWTNAPADATWINTNNWNARVVPGTINNTGNNGVDGSSIATFTNPIVTYGGAANPIVPDDATIGNGKSRMLSQINFDGPNCGAYVFNSPSPYAAQTTDTPETGVLSLCIPSQAVSSNGCYIGAAVTQPQNFLIPVQIRLPSSTDGQYGFTNNATSPLATYYFNNLFLYPGASSRGVTFIFDGPNTGTNTVALLSQSVNQAGGTCGVRKQGTGRWILSGANTFKAASPMNIVGGTLEVQNAGVFGSSTAVTVTNATLQIDGVILSQGSIALRNAGSIKINGIVTVNGISVGNQTATSVSLATTSASDVFTVGSAANTMTGGGGDSVVHLTGPGTILLPTSANYIGKWSIDSGTNQISDPFALGLGANVTVNVGAVLDTTLFGASSYSLTTKAISANGTGTTIGANASTIVADPAGTVNLLSRSINLTYSPTATNGDSTHPALYMARGILACGGNAVTVTNASGTLLNVGAYTLIHQASGNISASGTFATYISGNGLAPGLVGEVVATNSDIVLLVYPYVPQNLVWKGGNPDNTWDRLVSTNWLNGAAPALFNIYDNVTFNSVGAAFSTVNLPVTVIPASVVVDTTATSYTIGGAGGIAGGSSLTKIGVNTLVLNTVNTYSVGTVVSNGVLQVGVDDAVPSTGTGDVTVYSPGSMDLNGHFDTINGLNGNGVVDITTGGSSILELGANDDNGTFTGSIQNTSGTMGIWKAGLGTEMLTASNSFTGTTAIDTGTLLVSNLNALGSSALSITNGTLDMATNLNLASFTGTGGFVANSTTTTSNRLYIQGSSTINSTINGKVAVTVVSGTTRMNTAGSYVGGTILSSGTTLAFGSGAADAGAAGVIASNNVTVNQANTGSSSSAPTNNFTTVDGATVTFTSATTANNWNGQFIGSALATNVFANGNMSINGGVLSFSNFLGLVIVTNGEVRWGTQSGPFGGDNTVFDFVGTGGCFTRDATIVHLGVLIGNGQITSPSVGYPGTYWIGGKNVDCEFSGTISGSNNITKIGTGKLTLDGAPFTINTDNATYTNNLYTGSALTYLNTTTISNGVLAISVPNVFDSCPNITLATTNGILDTYNMGYITNFSDVNLNADSALVTNGILTLVASTTTGGNPQVLGGIGLVRGNGVINNGTINPGLAGLGGTLIISNKVTVNAGATNFFDLSDDPTGLVTPSDSLTVQGNMVLSGASIIGVGALNGVIAVGKYPVIRYTGNLINESGIVPPGPISNVSLGGPIAATTRATLVVTNATGEVDLTVVSLNNTNLTWQGDGVSNWWDVVNSLNWTNSSGVPFQFYQLDKVTFNDSSTNQSVILLGTLDPLGLMVNSSSNYIFGGTGNIGGDVTLVKTGTGTLILTNGANSYKGGTVISNGVLNVGSDSGGNQNDGALGTGPVSVVGATAELRFGGNAGNAVNHLITNAITTFGGNVKAQDGVQHLTNTPVTISASGGSFQTVFSGKDLVLDAPLVGTGNLLVSVPAGFTGGRVVLANGTNAFSGNVTLATNGMLALLGWAGISNVPSIDIQQGGILDASGRTNTAAIWTLLTNQTLRGNGTVRSSQITLAGGSTLAPGEAGSLGTLTATNFGTTNIVAIVNFTGTNIMRLTRALAQNSDRLVSGTNNFGGTLIVSNTGAALVAGDTFTLYTSITNKGSFAATTLPALSSGLAWSNTLAINGKLSVYATILVPSIPPAITNFSLVGGNIVISGTNGQAGGTYYLLTATNLAQPRNQWHTVATNVLGTANYTFIGTNAFVTNSPQQFYMLSSTNSNP